MPNKRKIYAFLRALSANNSKEWMDAHRKDYHAAKGGDEPLIYVHLSPKHSFIAGGLHNPDNKVLKSIRGAIDYDGDKLLDILHAKSFRDFYGELSEDPNKLKTSPQGYDADHEHIELLRRKDFTVMRDVIQEEVIADDFVDLVEQAYLELQPFNAYLKRAMEI